MRRVWAAGSLLVFLSVVAGWCPAIEQDVGKDNALAGEPDPSRRPQLDDAILRRLLREAAGEVAAARGERLDSQRSRTFDVLANAQESLGDAEGARLSRERSAKASASDRGSRFRSLRERAFDLVGEGKIKEAELVYEETVRIALDRERPAGVRGSPDLFDVVLTGTLLAERFIRAEEPEAARRALLRARAVVEAGDGFEHGFFVARAQAKMGDLDAARATLDVIRPRLEDAREPNRRLSNYQAMIPARWMSGDKDAARALYKEASVLARSQPVERHARSNSMNSLPTMLAAIEDYEGAFRMVAEEIDDAHKGSLSHSVVESIGRGAGLIPYARGALGYPPIDRETAREALRLAARSAGASNVEGIRNSLATIVGLQADLGDIEGARQSYGALAARGDREPTRPGQARALVGLARAEWKAGRRDAADVDFAEALRLAGSLPERGEQHFGRWPTTSYPRDVAIGSVVVARAELGDVDGAIETASQVRAPVQKARVLVSAARARRIINDHVGALRLARTPGHGFPSLPLLVEIADAETAAGAEAILRLALKEAEDYLEHRPHDPSIPPYNPSAIDTQWSRPPEGREREIRQHASAALEVARIRSKLGDIPGATRALEMVDDERWREDHLLGLLVQQLKAGDAPGAFARALALPSPSRRLSAIYSLSLEVKRLKGTPGHRPARS